MAGWRAKIIMCTVRVRRETGLMRLLTVMVSGGTPRRVSCPSTTVAHDRPEGRTVLKIAMSSYGVLALLLSEQS